MLASNRKSRKLWLKASALFSVGLLTWSPVAQAQITGAATPQTIAANRAFSATLPWDNTSEDELAKRALSPP